MDEEELLRAKKKAMSLLNYNDRTEWELMDRLSGAGFSEEAVNGAMEYVKSFHYIDDERYAMRFASIYCQSRSQKRIWQDLTKKHVPEKYISIALESVEDGEIKALEKETRKILKGREIEGLSYEEKQKTAAKLYRKGFETGSIRKYMGL
ncbi:MAG: regulatory protein RecX [Lachnospiraceae bacterium]|nr:regulatory protein RecX [Lachnospiraceae bacterium]